MRTARTILAIGVAVLAVGCGGGGGGDAPAPDGDGMPLPAATYNMDGAFGRMLSSGQSFTGLRGTVAGTPIELTLSFTPLPDGAYQGVVYHRAVQSATVAVGGVPQSSTSQTMYFTTGPVQLVAAIDAEGPLTTFSSTGSLPVAGVAGQSGPYALATSYASPGSTTVIGQTAMDWQLEPDTDSTVWACLVETLVGGGLSEQDCFRLDSQGNLSGARSVIVIGGETIVLTQ